VEQCDAFLAETEALAALVERLGAARGPAVHRAETGFKAWTVDEILQHLHLFNVMAHLALTDPERFRADYAVLDAHRKGGDSFPQATAKMVPGLTGTALIRAWREAAGRMAAAYAAADPKARVPWVGPDMSVRSAVTARLMETWAHGQAIWDLAGEVRADRDHIRNIAHLGVATYGWTFANRGLPVPAPQPFVRLTAPSGAVWEWGAASAAERVEGSATEFCQVVAQTRNVADTALQVTGANAAAWMAMAQCFAGAPHDPPAPGSRGIAR